MKRSQFTGRMEREIQDFCRKMEIRNRVHADIVFQVFKMNEIVDEIVADVSANINTNIENEF